MKEFNKKNLKAAKQNIKLWRKRYTKEAKRVRIQSRKKDYQMIVTPDQVQTDLDARIPDLKTALGGCCGGGVPPTCCAAITPVISGKCLCQQKPVELLKGVIGQDPSQFIGVAAEVLGKLGCNALDGAQVYPQCQA